MLGSWVMHTNVEHGTNHAYVFGLTMHMCLEQLGNFLGVGGGRPLCYPPISQAGQPNA